MAKNFSFFNNCSGSSKKLSNCQQKKNNNGTHKKGAYDKQVLLPICRSSRKCHRIGPQRNYWDIWSQSSQSSFESKFSDISNEQANTPEIFASNENSIYRTKCRTPRKSSTNMKKVACNLNYSQNNDNTKMQNISSESLTFSESTTDNSCDIYKEATSFSTPKVSHKTRTDSKTARKQCQINALQNRKAQQTLTQPLEMMKTNLDSKTTKRKNFHYAIIDDSQPGSKIAKNNQILLEEAWTNALTHLIIENSDDQLEIHINESSFVDDIYWIRLDSKKCVKTLGNLVENLPKLWSDCKLRFVSKSKVPKLKVVTILLEKYNAKLSSEQVLKIIARQNREFVIDSWKILHRREKFNETVLVLEIDKSSYETLQMTNGQIFFLSSIITINLDYNQFLSMPPMHSVDLKQSSSAIEMPFKQHKRHIATKLKTLGLPKSTESIACMTDNYSELSSDFQKSFDNVETCSQTILQLDETTKQIADTIISNRNIDSVIKSIALTLNKNLYVNKNNLETNKCDKLQNREQSKSDEINHSTSAA